ncbi:putative signal peptide protein [Puccinia sorghi]|uniref:Putative signal peptide protein n=1 Tax=Puccinia sorghi TaxID=27349 RepID=A0A0L6UMV3_9BASI|nr:putative signal peptide protein [Puccinia sorghi]
MQKARIAGAMLQVSVAGAMLHFSVAVTQATLQPQVSVACVQATLQVSVAFWIADTATAFLTGNMVIDKSQVPTTKQTNTLKKRHHKTRIKGEEIRLRIKRTRWKGLVEQMHQRKLKVSRRVFRRQDLQDLASQTIRKDEWKQETLQKELSQLPAVDIACSSQAAIQTPHVCICICFGTVSVQMVLVTAEVSLDLLHVNCRQLSMKETQRFQKVKERERAGVIFLNKLHTTFGHHQYKSPINHTYYITNNTHTKYNNHPINSITCTCKCACRLMQSKLVDFPYLIYFLHLTPTFDRLVAHQIIPHQILESQFTHTLISLYSLYYYQSLNIIVLQLHQPLYILSHHLKHFHKALGSSPGQDLCLTGSFTMRLFPLSKLKPFINSQPPITRTCV